MEPRDDGSPPGNIHELFMMMLARIEDRTRSVPLGGSIDRNTMMVLCSACERGDRVSIFPDLP